MSSSMTLDNLSAKLPDYLAYHNIEVNHKNLAVCPVHPDNDASFHVTGDIWHCFGCHEGGNIFHLAHLLEGIPDVGQPHFSTSTVPMLAERFGVDYDPPPPPKSPKEIQRMQMYQLYADVAAKISTNKYAGAVKHRGYDEHFAKLHGIGGLLNYRGVVQELVDKYGKEVVGKAGLFNQQLYNAKRVLFTIHDYHGRPIGFTGRRTSVTPVPEGDEEAAKYVNSYNNEIFVKGKMFYNIHRAKKYDTVYLMEGTTDVLTAVNHGIPNAIAILSNNFTNAQLEVLRAFEKVIIVLDGDNGGTSKTADLMKELKNATALLVPNHMDPDGFIKDQGTDAFRGLPELDALAWAVATKPYLNTHDAVEGVRLMLDVNPLKWKFLAELIAEASGMPLKDIRRAVVHEDQLAQRRRLGKLLKVLDDRKNVRLNLTIGSLDEDVI